MLPGRNCPGPHTTHSCTTRCPRSELISPVCCLLRDPQIAARKQPWWPAAGPPQRPVPARKPDPAPARHKRLHWGSTTPGSPARQCFCLLRLPPAAPAGPQRSYWNYFAFTRSERVLRALCTLLPPCQRLSTHATGNGSRSNAPGLQLSDACCELLPVHSCCCPARVVV